MTVNATPRRRGRPPRISRDQVLTVAMRIVDGHGLEGLTMRRLGSELGVDPMAVYGHVPDKTALIDGLVERAFAEVEVPAPAGEWAEDLRAVTRAARAMFLAHPSLIAVLGTRPPISEAAFALPETVTSILLAAGFTAEQAMDAFDCAGRLVIGHTLAEGGRPPGGDIDGGEREHRDAQHTLPAAQFPSLARIEQAGVRHDPDRIFEQALDGLILALAAAHPTVAS